jgi:hypothetical protein
MFGKWVPARFLHACISSRGSSFIGPLLLRMETRVPGESIVFGTVNWKHSSFLKCQMILFSRQTLTTRP